MGRGSEGRSWLVPGRWPRWRCSRPRRRWRIRARARTRSVASSFLSVQQRDAGSGMYPTSRRRARVRRRGRRRRRRRSRTRRPRRDPVEDADVEHVRVLAEHDADRLLGERDPVPRTVGAYNSDLAFQGNYAYQGTNNGFVVIDIENPARPEAGHSTTRAAPPARATSSSTGTSSCARGTPRPAPRRRDAVLRRHARRPGLRGHPHLRHHRPDEPRHGRRRQRPADGKQGLRFAADVPREGCGSHTATAVPDEARGYLYIYNGGSSGTCTWHGRSSRSRSPTRPTPSYVKQAPSGRQCHDNTVFLNGANSYATCAGGNGITMFKFDTTIDPTAAGRHREPDAAVVEAGQRRQRSATRPRSATTARRSCSAMSRAAASPPHCQTSELGRRHVAVLPERRDRRPDLDARCTRASRPTRELHLAQLQHRADQGRQLPRVRQLPGRHQRDRLHAARRAEGDRVRRPEAAAQDDHLRRRRLPGRRRLVDLLVQRQDLRVRHLPRPDGLGPRQRVHRPREHGRRTRTRRRRSARSRPTTSTPTVTSTNEGAGYLQGSTVPAAFSCADEGLGRRVLHGTSPTRNLDTSTIGYHSYTVTADRQGRQHDGETVDYMVNSTAVDGDARARTVPATLALTMGAPATFGAFTPGVAQEYTATTSANVISTAGDATLTRRRPERDQHGPPGQRHVRAARSRCRASASSRRYTGPVSNDQPTITFKQAIGANDALRTGTYSKTLTFTLSTTTP